MSLLKDDQAILRRKEDDQAIVPIKIKSNISFWHNILQPLFFIRDLSKEAIDLLHLPTNQYDINNNPIILIDLIFHDLLDNFDIRFFLTIDRNLLFGFRKVIIDNYMRMNKKNKKREKLLKLLLLFPSDSKIPKKMLEDFSEGLAAYRYDIESKETCNYDMYQCIFFCLLRYLMRKNVHSGIKKIVTEELIKLMFIIQEWKSIDSNLIENYFDVFYDYNAREIELFFDELDKIKYRDLFFYSFKKIAIKILFTLSMVIINIILFSKFKSEDKRLRIIMFFLKVITLYIFINCIYSAINYCSSNASNYMYSKKKNVEFLKKFLEKMLNF